MARLLFALRVQGQGQLPRGQDSVCCSDIYTGFTQGVTQGVNNSPAVDSYSIGLDLFFRDFAKLDRRIVHDQAEFIL